MVDSTGNPNADLIEKVKACYTSAKKDSLIAAAQSGLEAGMDELRKYANQVEELTKDVNIL